MDLQSISHFRQDDVEVTLINELRQKFNILLYSSKKKRCFEFLREFSRPDKIDILERSFQDVQFQCQLLDLPFIVLRSIFAYRSNSTEGFIRLKLRKYKPCSKDINFIKLMANMYHELNYDYLLPDNIMTQVEKVTKKNT